MPDASKEIVDKDFLMSELAHQIKCSVQSTSCMLIKRMKHPNPWIELSADLGVE